jgi:hypothetical protein
MSKTPEGLVLENCKRMLKTLELQGKVVYWNRLNVGLSINMSGYFQRQGRSGDPDIMAYVPVDRTMWVMFFEVKRPDGGIQSASQKEFEGKFKGFSNVIYAIITDEKQIKYLIHKVKGIPFNSAKYESMVKASMPEIL